MSWNNETTYTSYGGGGGGGGGFMPQQSQDSPSGRRDYSQDTLRPVTIKQILDAQIETGDEFKIDGTTITQLTFVGQIRNIAIQTTHITYKLEDGTGSIEVKQWKDADVEDDPRRAKLNEGTYCRAWGKPKNVHDRKQVIAQVIRPVEDMNEVSYHLLEATAVHLYHTKGPLDSSKGEGGATANKAGHQGTNVTPTGKDLSALTPLARKVFQCLLDAPQGNEGLHQQDIAARLGIDTLDVARAGDDLLEHGMIYTTVNDETWAILEAD